MKTMKFIVVDMVTEQRVSLPLSKTQAVWEADRLEVKHGSDGARFMVVKVDSINYHNLSVM